MALGRRSLDRGAVEISNKLFGASDNPLVQFRFEGSEADYFPLHNIELKNLAQALLRVCQDNQLREQDMKRLELSFGYYDIAIAFICMGMTFGMLFKSTL